VAIEGSRLQARGTSVGHPPPYVLTFELTTGDDFVTSGLRVDTQGRGWSRRLDLTRGPDGVWSLDGVTRGDLDLPDAGGDPGPLAGALDCDLGLSPLTNTMPVLRHDLHRGGGPIDFLMAWVSVPGLSVHPSEQRYTFIDSSGNRSIVRYEGKHRDFVGDLVFDEDGLVVHYPDLATRVAAS
jgi:hypothetical protein